jgi:hypothetical protein
MKASTSKSARAAAFILSIAVLCLQETSYASGFKFIPGSDTISPNWRALDYNDSNWQTAYYSIGYGYDDSTIVEPCASIFVRTEFEYLPELPIDGGVLHIDFDDAFVAYINGVEIARKNIGLPGQDTPFDMLAYRSRKSRRSFWAQDMLSYFVDSSKMAEILVEGRNVFSIQVHNDTKEHTDISLMFGFEPRGSYYSPYYLGWRAIRQVQLDSTDLPIIIIESHEPEPNNGFRQMANLKIIHSPGSYSRPSDSANVYQGWCNYEIRGQSSSNWAKKSYNVRLKDMLGATISGALLGMPNGSDWVLAANFTDRSFIRNMLVYKLAEGTNTTAPKSCFAEVIVNGDYVGLYQFLEKPERGKHRIDVEKQAKHETDPKLITGGYIFKFDKPQAASHEWKFGSYRSIDLFSAYPKKDNLSAEQRIYISSFWDSLFASALDSKLLDPQQGYRNFIDVESYIDFTILNELSRNSDGFRFSTFMHKPRGGKLKYGPLWDFDLSFGNSTAQDGHYSSGWMFTKQTNPVLMQRQFFKDSTLVSQFSARYKQLRAGKLSNNSIMAVIDSLAQSIEGAARRNSAVWPHDGHIVHSWVNNPQGKHKHGN